MVLIVLSHNKIWWLPGKAGRIKSGYAAEANYFKAKT